MFAQLQQMLRKGDTITVNIAVENETELRVTVFPKVFTLDGERGEDRQALNTPLSVVATAEELDGPTFIDTLTKFTASNTELRNTLDTVEAEHKRAAEFAKAKLKKPGTPAKAKATIAAPATAAPEPEPEPAEEEHNESLPMP
jgi:PRTRC genetic system protein E